MLEGKLSYFSAKFFLLNVGVGVRSAYEQSIFCQVFHAEESGWRECNSCDKVKEEKKIICLNLFCALNMF